MNGIIERMLENAQEHGCLNEVVKSAQLENDIY